MRGKDFSYYTTTIYCGITPVHAGKRWSGTSGSSSKKDHPRTCGEKFHRLRSLFRSWGSPPHMQGKGARQPLRLLDRGITPAHAGKRRLSTPGCAACEDHPRTCGEKLRARDKISAPWGSPPHMRGKAATGLNAASSSRITPAHAGKSYIRPALLRPEWDHPRTCGEKICIGLALVIMPGSPPHMRGKVAQKDFRCNRVRITPAHAGKRTNAIRRFPGG